MESKQPVIKLRVLVAEDNRSNQTIAQLFLKKMGHTVDIVSNGDEAMRAVAAASYDVVLMDCQMPEMDGFEATRAIRRMQGAERHTPIIAMTAGTSDTDRDQCLAAGMDDYISKPISGPALAKALAQHTAIDASLLFQLRSQDNGGLQLMHDVIVQYLEDAPGYIAALRQGVAEGDSERVRHAAHALKGASSNFNAGRLCVLSAQLEQDAEKGWLTQASTMVNVLQEEFLLVRVALENTERKAA